MDGNVYFMGWLCRLLLTHHILLRRTIWLNYIFTLKTKVYKNSSRSNKCYTPWSSRIRLGDMEIQISPFVLPEHNPKTNDLLASPTLLFILLSRRTDWAHWIEWKNKCCAHGMACFEHYWKVLFTCEKGMPYAAFAIGLLFIFLLVTLWYLDNVQLFKGLNPQMKQ